MSLLSLDHDWFQVDLPYAIPGTDFTVMQCLRFLRGRRLTVLAKQRENLVILKCFSEESEWLKEKNAHTELAAIKAPIAPLLHHGVQHQLFVLVYSYIKPSISWDECLPAQFDYYFGELIKIIGKLHDDGFIHHDPHLDNFLISQQGILLLDYSAIVKKRYISSLKKLWNLALCLVQAYPYYQMNQALLIEYYDTDGRMNRFSKKIAAYFVKLQHAKRVKRYQKKILRDCSQFSAKRYPAFKQVSVRSFDAKENFDPEALPLIGYLKQGRTATVWISQWQGQTIVIKRYNAQGWYWALRHLFKITRAERSWRNAHLLKQCGLNTPTPLLFRQNYKHGLPQTGYFVTGYLSSISVQKAIDTNALTIRSQRALEKLFIKMKALKICQTDMKGTNLLLCQETPYLIDLDSIQLYRIRFLFNYRWHKAWKRWLRNWEKKIDLIR